MILSHKHKFVFIKGLKVGGTSAEIALSQICGTNDVVTPITPLDERYRLGTAGEPRNYASRWFPWFVRPLVERRYVDRVRSAASDELSSIRSPPGRFHNHMTLARVIEQVPEAADYEVLCVERSPYAKIISLANWVANAKGYRKGTALARSPGAIAEIVDQLIESGKIKGVVNIDRYRRRDGTMSAIPWRTEHLAADFASFLKARGLPEIALVHAKEGFNSERADPSKLLRRDQIAAIDQIFAEEFETFRWTRLG